MNNIKVAIISFISGALVTLGVASVRKDVKSMNDKRDELERETINR